MAKLMTTVALISVLMAAMANTYFAYRTTITIVGDDSPQESSEQCRREVERQDLSSCMMYLSQSSGPRRSTEGYVLEMPGRKNPEQGRQQLQECCNELKQVRDECQCEAIKSTARSLLERGRPELQKQDYERVMQRAHSIGSSCGLREECRD